jgi:hypothetical protein|tara:strand:+ start:3216 stop:3611 length:396 start_codon:yes stop_codon:yes gene_type:complete
MLRDVTSEELKEIVAKYARPVFCNARKCKNWFPLPEGTGHHVPKFKGHESLGESDLMTGVCGRPNEIAIRDMGKVLINGVRQKRAECLTYSPRMDPAAVNFGALLQQDGSPYGGSLESQSHEYYGDNSSYV